MLEIPATDKLKFKYREHEFEISSPGVYLYRQFQKKLKEGKPEDAVDTMISFCEKVGVPEKVLEQMNMDEIAAFFKLLGSEKKT